MAAMGPRRSSRTGYAVPRTLALAAALAALASLAVLLSHGRGGVPFCGPSCLDARLAAWIQPDGRLAPTGVGPSRALLRAQLAFSPFETSAWLRLSALETAANGGRINAAANQSLEASYRYAPVYIPTARWRLGFVFDHWSEVAPAVRTAAERELRSLAAASANLRALSPLTTEIRDPSGRLAFVLLLDQLSR